MVENSLGRLWVEGHPNDALKAGWKYYLEEAEQEPDVQAQLAKLREDYARLNPEDIKIIDPCMGSGHILVYAFDVLMQIYEAQGYTQRDAARLIVEKNLYGLDIDKRAYQLAYFAVMMKARQYNRRILNGEIKPHLYAIQDSNGINRNQLQFFGWSMGDVERNKALTQVEYLLDTFRDAKEYGSILSVDMLDWELLYRFAGTVDYSDQISMDELNLEATKDALWTLIEQGAVLAQKYDVVVTNPPYMAVSNAGAKVNDYVKKNFPDSKADLFAVFIERCGQMAKKNGYQAMITQHAWMFLSSFERMRECLLRSVDIVSLAHLGVGTFVDLNSKVVQSVSFVFQNAHVVDYTGRYDRLFEQQGLYEDNQEKEKWLISGKHKFLTRQEDFARIPGSPVAYWVSSAFLRAFETGVLLGKIADAKQGVATADNNRFLRLWNEVSINKVSFHTHSHEEAAIAREKWFPYNKGGDFRKWYGNNEFVVNWEHDGAELKQFKGSVLRNPSYYFKECFSWSLISSSVAAFRYKPAGQIFDVAGMSCFTSEKQLNYLLALCNTKVVMKVLEVIAPTINYQCGDIANIPVIQDGDTDKICEVTQENISISKTDWDSYETSWDFKKNPLI